MTHALKTEPEYFEEVVRGTKTFEIRKHDRPFCGGDKILLQEFKDGNYTGAEWSGMITYMMDAPEFIKKGFVILGIKEVETI